MTSYFKHTFLFKFPQIYQSLVVTGRYSSTLLSDEGTKAQKNDMPFPRSHRKLKMVPGWEPGLLAHSHYFLSFLCFPIYVFFQRFKGNSDVVNKCTFLFSVILKTSNHNFSTFFFLCIFPSKKIFDYHSQIIRQPYLVMGNTFPTAGGSMIRIHAWVLSSPHHGVTSDFLWQRCGDLSDPPSPSSLLTKPASSLFFKCHFVLLIIYDF